MKQAGIRFEAKRKCLLPVKRSGSAAEDSRLPHVNTCCVGWPSVGTGGSKCGCGKNGRRADEMGAGRKGEGRKSEPARPAGSGPAEGSMREPAWERIDALAIRAFEEVRVLLHGGRWRRYRWSTASPDWYKIGTEPIGEPYLADYAYGIMVSRAGLEPGDHSEPSQVIDFNKLQKRQNRYFRRFEVHGGYAEQQRTAQKNASNQGRRPLTGITPGRPFLLISETNCKAGLLPSRSSQRSWRRPASFKLALGGRARARCGRSLVRRKLHRGY